MSTESKKRADPGIGLRDCQRPNGLSKERLLGLQSGCPRRTDKCVIASYSATRLDESTEPTLSLLANLITFGTTMVVIQDEASYLSKGTAADWLGRLRVPQPERSDPNMLSNRLVPFSLGYTGTCSLRHRLIFVQVVLLFGSSRRA